MPFRHPLPLLRCSGCNNTPHSEKSAYQWYTHHPKLRHAATHQEPAKNCGPALTKKELPQKEQHANYIKNVLHCNHRR